MSEIIIYSKSNCPFCERAKNLFDSKDLKYNEIILDGKDEEFSKLIKKTGFRTVPQIFINGKCIGGYSDLIKII